MSIRDQILEAQDIGKQTVEVPEWGVTIEVRGMTALERTRLMDLAFDAGGQLNLQTIYPEIVIATCFDPETGMQIFTPQDKDALLSKSSVALDRVAIVGMSLSGFTAESADESGKVSSATPPNDSSLS